ncbi:PD40 domain-containing protein [Candidatus Saccharibacteria bacterium]|nr:PD40 domain-containing protein [Candidatus Saccharibacteria bacterium]
MKTKIKKIFTGGIVLAFASILLSSVAIVNLTQRAQAAYAGNDGKVLHVKLSEQDNVAQLIQSNIDGTSQTVLNQDVGFFAGRYSKGGSKIVAVAAPDYETIGAGKSDMYLLNADGSGLEYLLGFDQGYIINGASFTNNDQNIIFGAAYFDNDSEEGTWGIYSYNIASQQVAQISISPAGYCDFYPIPSPDGSKIAFLRHQDVNNNLESFIRVMNVDGSDNHQLTYTLTNNMGSGDTTCSRAGTSMSILYGSFLGGEPSTTLDWSPDGQKIVYESSNDINTGSTMFITTELNTVDIRRVCSQNK